MMMFLAWFVGYVLAYYMFKYLANVVHKLDDDYGRVVTGLFLSIFSWITVMSLVLHIIPSLFSRNSSKFRSRWWL